MDDEADGGLDLLEVLGVDQIRFVEHHDLGGRQLRLDGISSRLGVSDQATGVHHTDNGVQLTNRAPPTNQLSYLTEKGNRMK